MDVNQSREILSGYSAEKRRTLQELVDKAVRAARVSGYCDQFEHVMRAIAPEFILTGTDRYGNRIHRAFDSDGQSCRGETVLDVLRGRRGPIVWSPDGFDMDGYDRDGVSRNGYDRTGFDAEGWTSASDRDGFYRTGFSRRDAYRLWATDGMTLTEEQAQHWDSRGRYVYLDRDGKPRIGRAATAEELTEEASGPTFNPTTWTPEGATGPAFTKSDEDLENDYDEDDD
jgi:hypothetical protein